MLLCNIKFIYVTQNIHILMPMLRYSEVKLHIFKLDSALLSQDDF